MIWTGNLDICLISNDIGQKNKVVWFGGYFGFSAVKSLQFSASYSININKC